MVWPAFSNLSGMGPWKTKCSNCESDENRHRGKKTERDRGKYSTAQKRDGVQKKDRKTNYFSLYSPASKSFFSILISLFLRLSFSQKSCSSIWFKWLGQCEVREEESWGSHTDGARQRQSICMPCGGKKVLGRQTVSANPWQAAEARRLQTRPGGCCLTDGALWLLIAWEGGICLINEKHSAASTSEDLGD